MPRPSKRSQAGKTNANRPTHKQKSENESKKENSAIQSQQNEINFRYLNQVSGNFHQGESIFSEDSRGLQCSCNALVMLCRIPNIIHQLDKNQLDQILIDGDYIYRMTSQYLNNLGEMHGSNCLETTQLPTLVSLSDRPMYEVNYKPLIYCVLKRQVNNDLRSLYEELQVAFTTVNSIILVLGGYMIAIYRDPCTEHYVVFDSHSRDEFGFPSPNGNSVALVFEDFENTHKYLFILCQKLNITSQIIGIQAIETQAANQQHYQIQHNRPNTGVNELLNDPGSSTSATNSSNSKNSSNIPTSRLSRYQKWYQSLPDERRNQLHKRKRTESNEVYTIPEKAERKKRKARELSRESYAIPEKAASKKRKARELSRESYAIPEKAAKKRKQNQSNRRKNKSDISTVIADFKKSCKGEQLVYICQICQRVLFKKQVLELQIKRYNKSILEQSLTCGISQLRNICKNTPTWICYTCHQDLLKNRVPKLANVNKLELTQQPQVLSELNMLERHLVSPAILFMKMIPLIKGAQKGIYGQVVCVKSKIHSTAACLPRLPTEQSLIRVKLKRKLEYKGHHMCQDVNPEKIKRALEWLKDNNPVFKDINIDFTEFDSMLDDDLIHNQHDDHENNITNHDQEDTGNDGSETENLANATSVSDNTNENHVSNCIVNNSFNSEHDEDDTPTTHSVSEINQSICDNKEEIQIENNDETGDHDDEDYITNTSAPLYSFLHPVDFAQYVADKHDESILCIAPGEGNTPEIVSNMEDKCFPIEFPTASNTFNETRDFKLSPSRYFNARIFSADTRFVRNPEYIFFALYSTEVQQIHDNISIALRRGNTKTTDGREITASMLTNHEEVRNLIRRDEGYRFLAKIRGTPAYWEKSKKDVFAMIRQLGIPTFFVTFSAADRRWIDISNSLLISQGKEPLTVEQHKSMSWEEHCKLIMSNPAAAARLFQERFNTLMKNVILSFAKPAGEVEDYYYRIEFQQRGWPHVHMILWIKNAPVFNQDSDETITEFIDKYISCKFPSDDDPELQEIVSNVQTFNF